MRNKGVFSIILIIFFAINAFSQTTLEKVEKIYRTTTAKREIRKLKAGNDPFKDLYIGILYHNIAARRHFEYAKDAIEYCTKAYEKTSLPLALSYHGSALTLQAAGAIKEFKLIEAIQKISEGNRLIDKAVSIDEENLNTRLFRYFHAIAYSENAPQSRKDIAALDKKFIDKHLNRLNKELKSAVFHFAARLNILNGEKKQAKTNFIKSILADPKSLSGKISKKLIKKYFPDSQINN